MPADSDNNAIEQQAVHAMNYLSPEDKKKVLEYINSLITLDKATNDQRSVK
jgi:hypothetical protein